MEENIVVTSSVKLEQIKKEIRRQGPEKLHIISDFDRTLTCAFVGGLKRPSLISVLRDGNYLTPDYAKKAHSLFNKYHPLEINPEIPIEEKKKLMQEWWETHFELLIKSGLNKKDLEKVISSEKVKLRKGALEFINFLHSCNIPLIIMSSTGLGGEAVSYYLEKYRCFYNNVHIISNFFEWGKKGNAVGYKRPIIHCMNKDETLISNFPDVYEKIKDRKNTILLGDSLGDVGMIEGFNYHNLIKIGFLNEDVETNLEQYKRSYDVLILNDSSMDFVNDLMAELLK